MEDLRLESRCFDFKFFVCSTVLPQYHVALLDKKASFNFVLSIRDTLYTQKHRWAVSKSVEKEIQTDLRDTVGSIPDQLQ